MGKHKEYMQVEFKGVWMGNVFWNGGIQDMLNPNRQFSQYILEHENPVWLSREEIENDWGKIEVVLVNKKAWEQNKFDTQPIGHDLLIFTKNYVLTIYDYDGGEYLIGLPRNPEHIGEIHERA